VPKQRSKPGSRTQRLAKTTVKRPARLRSSWQLSQASFRLIVVRWQFFAWFVVVMAVLNLLLVHNFGADISSLKTQVEQLLGASSSVVTGGGTYALLLSQQSSPAGAAGVYQYALLVIGSLALVWALRRFMGDKPPKNVRVRDAFYQGMYPLVPFVLVLIVLALLLLPLTVGGAIYSIILANGIAATAFENILWFLLFFGCVVLSVWLLLRWMFAPYIVTLPGSTPVKALREANQLIQGYKLIVVRKLLFLGMSLTLLSALLAIPAILIAPLLAQIILFCLSICYLPLIHTYLYTLYRELIGE